MTSIPAESVETSTSPEVDQSAADAAFERDLSDAGLLDSPLDGSDTPAEPVESAPKAAPADTSTTPGATAEPTAGATPPAAGTPDATGAPPAPEAKEPTAEELAAKAQPFGYTADGEARSVEFIREIPGEGVVIEAAHIDQFRNFVQTADKALRDNVGLRDTVQRYERLGGVNRVAELQAKADAVDAMGTRLLSLLLPENREQLANLYNDPREAQLLLRELQIVGQQTMGSAAQQFQQSLQQASAPDEGQIQEKALVGAIGQMADWAKQNGVTLTDADLQAAYQQFAPFKAAMYRDPTPQELQMAPQLAGRKVWDTPKMHGWFADRVQQRKATAEQEAARKKAEDENAKRLPAAPVAARRPNQRPGAGKKTVPAGEKTWSQIKNDWLSGRFAHESGE